MCDIKSQSCTDEVVIKIIKNLDKSLEFPQQPEVFSSEVSAGKYETLFGAF